MEMENGMKNVSANVKKSEEKENKPLLWLYCCEGIQQFEISNIPYP